MLNWILNNNVIYLGFGWQPSLQLCKVCRNRVALRMVFTKSDSKSLSYVSRIRAATDFIIMDIVIGLL